MPSDIIRDFSGGHNSFADADRIAENQAAYLENWEYRDGILRTRRGSFMMEIGKSSDEFQGFGVFRSPLGTSKHEQMLIAAGNSIYLYKPPHFRQSMTLPFALKDEDVHFIQGIGYIYIFRGEHKQPWRWNGEPTTAIEEVSEPTTGSVMPGTDVGIFAFNRFWTKTGVDFLNISDSLSEAFDLNNNRIQITKGDGQKITGIAEYLKGRIVVFKNHSIAVVENAKGAISNASQDLEIDFVDNHYGCGAQYTIVNVGKDIFFLSTAQRGVMTLQLNEEQEISLAKVPLSEPMKKEFERVTWGRADLASAVVYDNYYLIALPIDGSSRPNAIFAYDLIINAWVGIWTFRNVREERYDSIGDPVYSILRLERFNYYGRDICVAVGWDGSITELLTNDNRDFAATSRFWVNMTTSNRIDMDSVPAGISSQTTGIIEFRFRLETIASEKGICEITGSGSSAFEIYIDTNSALNARLSNNSGTHWRMVTANNFVTLNQWYDVTIVQDGTEPVLYVNGFPISVTFSAAGTPLDKTKWFTNLTALDTFNIGQDFSGSDRFDGDIEHFHISDWDGTLAGSVRAAPQFLLALNEGEGATLTDPINSVSADLSPGSLYTAWAPVGNDLCYVSFLRYFISDYATSTNIFTQTLLGSQTQGIIEIKFKYITLSSNKIQLLTFYDSAGSEQMDINLPVNQKTIQLKFTDASATVSYDLNTNDTSAILVNTWHIIRITHNGTAPSISIDGVDQVLNQVVSTDLTAWFNDVGFDTCEIGDSQVTTSNEDVDIEYVHIMNIDGSTVAMIPNNNVTTLTASNDSNITFAVNNDPQLCVKLAENHIRAQMNSRAALNSPTVKDIHQVEITTLVKGARYTLKAKSPDNVEKTLISKKTYAEDEYYVHGLSDWTTSNANKDHDAAYRKNYTPLTIPQAGFTIDQDGITMNKEVEHTEFINPEICDESIEFELVNDRGQIGLKQISVNSVEQGFPTKRGMH